MNTRNWVPAHTMKGWVVREATSGSKVVIPVSSKAHAQVVAEALRGADNQFRVYDRAWIYSPLPDDIQEEW